MEGNEVNGAAPGPEQESVWRRIVDLLRGDEVDMGVDAACS